MNFIKKGTAAGAVAAVAAGAFVLATATGTQAAPPNKNTPPILVDANGVPVSDVVDIPEGTTVIRLVDGGLFRFATTGELQGDVQGGKVAYRDAACTEPVLVNGDFGDDPTARTWVAPFAMSAVTRTPYPESAIKNVYVADGAVQTGTVYTTHWLEGYCEGPVLDNSGNVAAVNYYAAKEIPIPADLPGPLAFK